MKLLNEILGTKYPIIQGGMANIATGEFAAACSNAGALGLIGAGGMNAETLRENIHRCKALTDKPFGVNIMLMHPQADEFAKIVVEEGVKVVTTGAATPASTSPCGRKPVSRSSLWWQRPFWPSTLPLWAWMPSSPKAPRAAAMWAR